MVIQMSELLLSLDFAEALIMYRNKAYSSWRSAFLASHHPGPAPGSGSLGGFRSGSANGKQFSRSAMATVHASRRNSAVANAHLTLTVPGGSNHDTLPAGKPGCPGGAADRELRLRCGHQNRFADHGDRRGTSRGLMVLADDQDFITFALVTDGTNISLTAQHRHRRRCDHCVRPGQLQRIPQSNLPAAQQDRQLLHRLLFRRRSVWIQAASFIDTRVPTFIGPFAGNYNNTPRRLLPWSWLSTGSTSCDLERTEHE